MLHVALALVLAGSGCTKGSSMEEELAIALGTRNGVIIVVDLAECNVTRESLAYLDALAKRPGIVVKGIAIRPPTADEKRRLLQQLGISFVVIDDSSRKWERMLSQRAYAQPLGAIVLEGHVQALAWGNVADDLKPLLMRRLALPSSPSVP